MEPVTYEEEKNTSSVSQSSTPSSGIRATLSLEDSDSEIVLLNGDEVSNSNMKNKGSVDRTSSSDSSSSDSRSSSDKDERDKEEEDDEGFMSGQEGLDEEVSDKSTADGEFDVPLEVLKSSSPSEMPPIAKVSADEEDEFDEDGVAEEGEGSKSYSAAVRTIPKVLAARVEPPEADDTFETAVAASRYADAAKFDDLVSEKGFVIGNEKKTEPEVESVALVQEPKAEVEAKALIKNQGSSDTVEPAIPNPEADGLRFTNEGDAVVESIHVDLGEAVRTGAAVVGDVDENKGLEVGESASATVTNDVKSSDEGNDVTDSMKFDSTQAAESGNAFVEVTVPTVDQEPLASKLMKEEVADGGVEAETYHSEPRSAPQDSFPENVGAFEVNGVQFTSQGDSVVQSIDIDPVEAVRSGVAVVRDANGQEFADSLESVPEIGIAEADLAKLTNLVSPVDGSTNVEPSSSGGADAGNEKEQKGSADVESVPVNSNTVEPASVKFTNEGDSVVESINVDPVEAVRSGKAIVGETEKVEDSDRSNSATLKSEETVVDPTNYKNDALTGQQDDVIMRDAAISIASTKVDSIKAPTETIQSDISGSIGNGEKMSSEIEPKGDSAAVEDTTATIKAPTETGQSNISGSIDNGEKLSSEIEPKADSAAVEDTMATIQADDESGVSVFGRVKEENKEEVDEVKSQQSYGGVVRDGAPDETRSLEAGELPEALTSESRAEPKESKEFQEDGDVEGSTDGETDNLIFGNSAAARQFMQELEKASRPDSSSGAGSSQDNSQRVDGQIITDSEEEADSEEEQDGKELFDSAALAALLKAASNANVDPSNVTVTSQDGSRLFSIERPAGLGSSLRSVRPQARPSNSALFNPSSASGVSEEDLSAEEKKRLEKIQHLRVKFLRLVQRLGHSAEDSIASQVLYRLALVAGRPAFPSFSLEVAKQTAKKMEEEGKEELSFSLNILLLGKLGVGKSATINSIFGEEKVKIDAFGPGTTSVTEVSGNVNGVNIRIFDTPGLKSSALEQGFNRKVLASVKKFTKKNPPDIVLYVDRLDAQTRDLNDLPLLRTITSSLGSSIWRNAIVTLTHGACAPPDGPSGTPLNYDVFVTQRSHIVQQYVGQAVGDLRLMNPSLMNPVSLVENHPACRKNRGGLKVLPNGQPWRPQLLLLCFSMKILSEATSISKSQDIVDHRKLFGLRARSPPLPYLLSSLLQPRAHPKLSADQGVDNGDSDIEVDNLSDSDEEVEEDEYDQLPPFKPLRKSQLENLSKEQRKAYFEEYDYRVKLLQQKQWREEVKRMKEMKKKGKVEAAGDYGETGEDFDPENGAPAAVPVPLPDMALPPTFDGDNPAYRYRFLEPSSQFLARPVLDTHGWDHDCGYDGVNLEHSLGIVGRYPANVTVQVTKDKKEFNLHMDSSVAAKHGDHGSSLAGFDIQNIGKQLAYIVRGETKFKNLKKNRTAAGVSVTFLGENVATGVKVEDQIAVGKRLVLVGSTGTVRSQKDAAYGANLEVRLREADYPIGQDQSSFVLSLMKWRGDLALGANLQSQVSVGRNSKMALRVALNNKMSGQITLKTSSSDHLQLALAGLLPLALSLYRFVKPGVGEGSGSMYF